MASVNNKGISGLARTYSEYVQQLRVFSKNFYSDILADLGDSSIGQWVIDLNASIGCNLSNYIDRAFQEGNINEAQKRRSLLAIARTKGLKIPGRKASLVEVEISATLPLDTNQQPDYDYAPILRKGSQAMGGGGNFELLTDCDFSVQFDGNGISNRVILPNFDSNMNITGYTIRKREIMSATTTKYYKIILTSSMIKPFMEIVLPDENVVQVESIILKDGTDYIYTPYSSDFQIQDEYLDASRTQDQKPTWRYFEVDSLLEDKLFLPSLTYGTTFPITYPVINIPNKDNPQYAVVKGEWKYISQKFITEYTDKGYLKVIFGAGSDYVYESDTAIQRQISRIINNKNMGILPNPNTTMWIEYKIGGGKSTNVPPGTITSWVLKDFIVNGKPNPVDKSANEIKKSNTYRSIKVTNTSSSMGGKDAPSNEEIRYMIKYNNLSQNRAVTLKDYLNKINNLPPIYGVPFRTGIVEKNNMIYISIIGIDEKGKLTESVSSTMVDNIATYLSEYKMITDYVVVKPGRVINLQIECDLVINKSYNNNTVVRSVINTVYDFFDVNNHNIGDNLYCASLIKDILNVSGVDNLIELRVYNIFSGQYSNSRINQATVPNDASSGTFRAKVDLEQSENILYSETDSMYEIKEINSDIKIRVKNI